MSAKNQQPLTRAKAIEHEVTALMINEGINIGSTEMAAKLPSGVNAGGGHAVLKTNVYGLLTRPQIVYRYDVAVNGYTRFGRVVELAKKVSSDALYVDRRANCRDVIIAFQEQFPDFLKTAAGNRIYYDLQLIMFSLLPLDVHQRNTFAVVVESLNVYFERIEIRLQQIGELTLGDLSAVSGDVGLTDKSLEQFLNIATSQRMMFDKDNFVTFSSSVGFLLNPEVRGFNVDDTPMFADNGSYLAIGLRKGVRYVEGPHEGSRNTALVVKVKKAPFHSMEPAIAKASRFVADVNNCQNDAIERLTYMMKGLQMETNYGRMQKFLVTGVSRDSAQSKRITIGEGDTSRETTVRQYYQDRYGIALRYPTAPLLEARGRNSQTNFYPLEMCVVSDNQRVRSHQQTPRQIQEMIKKCAIPPSLLFEQNCLITHSLQMTNNEKLEAAQIRVVGSPLCVCARILSPPSLQYNAGNVAQVHTDSFIWQGRHFLLPANIRVWAAYAFNGGVRDSINDREFCKFIDHYLTEARASGIQIPDPADIRSPRSDPEVLKREMRLADQNGVEFILVVHPDTADDMHAALKLCERDFSIITQGVKIGTVRSVINKGQRLTVQNIVNKTNVKMGGLNYSLVVHDETSREVIGCDSLFIGFGMAHPASGSGLDKENGSANNGNGNGNGGSDHGNGSSSENSDVIMKAPSVVGYAANIGKNPFEFIGDFLFQEFRRDEKVNLLRHIVTRCVAAYRVNQRKDPRRIFIYRNGCGEGQFPMILRYEIPLVKSAVEKIGCGAKVTVIVSNKLQNIRFFQDKIDARARATEQNIRPGSVIDSGVVHPFYREFFLNAHRALQGTTKTPKYTVLYDDNNLTMDQVEGITHHLCYGHQIVWSPTSLPSPVYIAMLYAERGQMLYRRYKSVMSTDEEPRRYSELTERLGYEKVETLGTRRINA